MYWPWASKLQPNILFWWALPPVMFSKTNSPGMCKAAVVTWRTAGLTPGRVSTLYSLFPSLSDFLSGNFNFTKPVDGGKKKKKKGWSGVAKDAASGGGVLCSRGSHSFIWDAKVKSELDWHVCAEPSFWRSTWARMRSFCSTVSNNNEILLSKESGCR